jgi:hypothetical protein
MIHYRERGAGFGVKKFRGIRRFALDAQEDVESSGASGRNCGLRVSV